MPNKLNYDLLKKCTIYWLIFSKNVPFNFFTDKLIKKTFYF